MKRDFWSISLEKNLIPVYSLVILKLISMVHVTTDATFAQDISQGVALVDFWAEWCGPCQAMLPRLKELSENIGDSAKIMKMNVDENMNVPGMFRIMSIPTMILFKDGQPVEKVVGLQDSASLETLIRKYL